MNDTSSASRLVTKLDYWGAVTSSWSTFILTDTQLYSDSDYCYYSGVLIFNIGLSDFIVAVTVANEDLLIRWLIEAVSDSHSAILTDGRIRAFELEYFIRNFVGNDREFPS